MLFTYAPPMQTLFGSRPLDLDSWLRMLAGGGIVFAVVELEKIILRRLRD